VGGCVFFLGKSLGFFVGGGKGAAWGYFSVGGGGGGFFHDEDFRIKSIYTCFGNVNYFQTVRMVCI